MSTRGPQGNSPTKWAATYYAKQCGQPGAPLSLRGAKAFWDEIDPRPLPQAGLPGYVPRLSSTAQGVTNLDEVLIALQRAHSEGYGESLVSAMDLCFEYSDAAPPEWVRRAFRNGIGRLRARVAADLDDAFNIARAQEKKADAAFAQLHGGQIYLDVVKAHEAGVSIGDPLFAVIAKRYGKSGSTVKRIYYAEKIDVKGVHFSENYAIETTREN